MALLVVLFGKIGSAASRWWRDTRGFSGWVVSRPTRSPRMSICDLKVQLASICTLSSVRWGIDYIQ